MKLVDILNPKLDRLGEGSAVVAGNGEVFLRNSDEVDSWSSPLGRHYKSDHIQGRITVLTARKERTDA